MNRTKKILIGVSVFAFIALVICAWVISSKFDGEELRKYASQTMREQYQRDLSISGELKLQILPTIAIVAKGVGLSNPDKFPAGQFIKADSIKINVATLPLLFGKIQVEEIKADGLIVNLVATADGRQNWDFQGATSKSQNKSSGDKFSSDYSFNIDRVDLLNGKLTYGDERTRTSYLLEFPKISMNQSSGKSNLDIALLKDGINLQIKGQINSFDDLMNFTLGQANPVIKTQLKLLINKQSMDINATWVNQDLSNSKTSLPSKFTGSIKADSLDLPVMQNLLRSNDLISASESSGKRVSKVTQSGRIFNSDPIDWSLMPNLIGDINIDLQKLKITEQHVFGPLTLDAHFNDDEINVSNLNVSLSGGTFLGNIHIKGRQTTNPQLHISGKGEGFSAQGLAALTGSQFRMSGGATDIGMNVTGSGKSIHEFVSTLNGQTQVTIGSGQLAPSKLNQSGDLLMSLIKVVDPRRNYSQTNLTCLVAYLPVRNGVITVQDSIGFETDQLYMLMAGVINLGRETLVLDVKARDPSGLTTGISIASMAQIQGSLSNPQVGINKAGVAKQGLNIGLGVLTAGISILAENANSLTEKTKPCQKATRSWAQVVGN